MSREAVFSRLIAGPQPPTGRPIQVRVFEEPISFLGEVEPREGLVRKNGASTPIAGALMVFPQSRGSTVGSYVIYALSYYGKAPAAMLVEKAEPLLITGCVIGEIPLLVAEGDLDYSMLSKCGLAVLKETGGKDHYRIECTSS